MSVVNVKELGRSASAVVAGVVDTRRPAVITRSGHPVAVLVPLDAASTASALEDWALAHVPEFVRSRAVADREGRDRLTIEASAFFKAQGRPHKAAKRAAKPGR
jgi:prevent-host-death family protein